MLRELVEKNRDFFSTLCVETLSAATLPLCQLPYSQTSSYATVEYKRMYLNRNLGGARRVTNQPVTKITIDPEPCVTMLLESDWSLGDCCLSAPYVQGSAMDAVDSGETRSAARNSQAYHSNEPSVKSMHLHVSLLI